VLSAVDCTPRLDAHRLDHSQGLRSPVRLPALNVYHHSP
jgi:hypothetical protein